MCNPIAIGAAFAAMTAGQIVAQNRQARKTAEAQQEAINTQTNLQSAALSQQATEVQRAASEQATQQQLQAAQVASQVAAQAGEAGITGTGVNRLVSSVGQQAQRELAITESNTLGQVGQIRSQQEAGEINRRTQLGNIQSQLDASTVGPLAAIARIGASFIGGAATGGALTGAGAAAGTAGTAGTAAAAAGTGLNFLSTLSNFVSPSDQERIDNAQATGYSDEYRSGGLIKQQINTIGV